MEETAGRLEEWCVMPERILDPCLGDAEHKVVVGKVYGSSRFPDGTKIVTSNVVKIESGFVYTRNSRYELGGSGRMFP